LPHLNPDWFFPFWYQLTQVVLEKRPLNGSGSSSSAVPIPGHYAFGLSALSRDHFMNWLSSTKNAIAVQQ